LQTFIDNGEKHVHDLYTNETNYYECSLTNVATVTAVVAWNVFFIGLFANIALVCLALKKLVSRNDKLHLANIVASNLFSLLGSFLGELLSRGNIIPSAQKYCFLYHLQISFISLFNNLTSMAALCYNLYENIVKFPGNRLLSFSSSLKIVVAIWISSQVLLSADMSGFIIAQQEGADICKKDADKTTYEQVVSFFCLIVLITIWISVFTTIIRISLTGVSSKLKQHRQQTENVMRNQIKSNQIYFAK
jgi:hypothetical protein